MHGDGHAAYLLGNRCIASYVHTYFTDGVLPRPGARCASELLGK
ncbi:alpha/beta hydrolase [Kibdelosporangium philippinense]